MVALHMVKQSVIKKSGGLCLIARPDPGDYVFIEANKQGIAVYTVTPNNIDAVLSKINASVDVVSDIRNATASGKQVTVTQRPVSYNTINATGYVISDPETGAGAYLLDSGLNGGSDCSNAAQLSPLAQGIAAMIVTALVLLAIAELIAIIGPVIITVSAGIGPVTGASAQAITGGIAVLGMMVSYTEVVAAADMPPPPSSPGDGLKPPGTCDYGTWAALQADVEAKCNNSGKMSCGGDMECATLNTMKSKALACIAARQTINAACFGGGDGDHIEQINERLKGVANCDRWLAKKGCNDGGC